MKTSIKSKREVIIDLARGFAVAMMIITHVIAVAYDQVSGTSSIVYYIGLIGGIGSFTTFLFLSGTSTYLSYLKYDNSDKESIQRARTKLIHRSIKLLILYYLLATASIFVTTTLYPFPPSVQWLENIIKTLGFVIVPVFTEFILAILFYWVTLIPFRKFYKYLSNNPLLGIFISALLFVLGQLILSIDLGNAELNTIKGLFGGYSNLHLFPVLQYFPIFFLGILYGKFIYNVDDKRRRFKVTTIWLLCAVGLSIASTLIFDYLRITLFNPLPDAGRFPPSLGFLALSLTISLTIIVVLSVIYRFLPNFLKIFLHFSGVNALELFFFHVIILFVYRYITTSVTYPEGAKHPDLPGILIIYAIVLILSIILTNIKEALKNWVNDYEDVERTWWFFTEKAISTLILVIIFAFVGTTIYRDIFVKPALADTTAFQFKKRVIQEEEWPIWWNFEYKAARQLEIENDNFGQILYANSWVGITFNHRDALGRGSALRQDGNDIRIVYFDFELGEFKELPFILENPNSENTKIYFKLAENINPGETSDRYFLYYGNEFTSPYPQAKDRFTSKPIEDNIALSEELSNSIAVKVNKRWFLKKKATAYQAASLLFEATIDTSELSENSVVTYSISGTDKSGRMKKVGDNQYQAAVAVADLEPGVYRIQANVTDSSEGVKIKRSFKSPFYVTYPLYVNWSLDWEGWDVTQDNLNVIANIADSNGIPITHFFNPRIFVKNQYTMESISEQRADAISDWVKERQKNRFEEIGMHIHMWADMVAEAGVTPRNVFIRGTYGVDVPTYEYTREELETVFRWGRLKFAEYGLGAPISYRTGAWMSGPHVLQAAQNTGFLIDSSGRTGGLVNPTISYSTPVPWSLSETTRPYYPNVDNINTWNGNMSTRLKIMEFPNNGADSYWFPEGELLRRFDLNYPNKGDILYSPQVVTYLSHPHWFATVDQYKIRNLFNYINQFKYEDDKGPVIYETLQNIYSEWDRDKFINGN